MNVMASKVHRVRFYNPKPQPINCISFNKNNKYLAVARGDASIELWDLNYAPYLLKFIPSVENGSVEALSWVNDRLLSAGLGGALVEWDLEKLNPKSTVFLTGNAAWCLDVNLDNTLVAIGTEQGYINLYSVENEEIIYKKLFDKQEGRILCCKFNKLGNLLVTGSINTIRVWNVDTGHAMSRMSVSRRGQETIVWCLAVLSDNTVVSGDSKGRLTFWDGVMGEHIEAFTTHKTDILSIAITEDERNMYCSGADPVIVNFIKIDKTEKTEISGENNSQWIKNVQRNIHQHDVRALALNGEQLISVGLDGYLTLSSYPPKWVMRLPPMIPMQRSSVCPSKKLLLLRFSNHLEVWKLGSYATGDSVSVDSSHSKKIIKHKPDTTIEADSQEIITTENMDSIKVSSLKLLENPLKLLSVQTKGNKQILCAELSPTGEFIVYCTITDFRMLKLEIDEDQSDVSVSRVSVSGAAGGCTHVSFGADGRTLAARDGDALRLLHVDADAGATLAQTLPLTKHLKTTSILHLQLSKQTSGGVTYLVAADSQGAAAVWARTEGTSKKFEHYVTLPTYRCVPSALTIDCFRKKLIIVYVDQKIVEYDLQKRKFSSWTSSGMPLAWQQRRAAVTALAPHPAADRAVLLAQDVTGLWRVDKNTQGNEAKPKEVAAKKKRKSGGDTGVHRVEVDIIPIKYLAGFHWIGDDEAVTIEMLPENIISQLPPISVKKNNSSG